MKYVRVLCWSVDQPLWTRRQTYLKEIQFQYMQLLCIPYETRHLWACLKQKQTSIFFYTLIFSKIDYWKKFEISVMTICKERK